MIDAAVLARTGEAAKAGPIGLAVILLLCIACYFLFKSMSKHMKVVREQFPTGADAPPAARPAASDVQRAELVTTELVRTEARRTESGRTQSPGAEPTTAQPALPPAEDDEPDRAAD